MDYKTVTAFLKNLYPGLTVILQDQNAQSPALPYCTWFEVSGIANGFPEVDHFESGGQFTERVSQNKNSRIQVDFYTETISQAVIKSTQNFIPAKEFAEQFILRTGLTTSIKFQRDNKIGFLDWVDQTGSTQFLGDKSEARATIEMTINDSISYQQDSNAIDQDTISVNLTLEGLQ